MEKFFFEIFYLLYLDDVPNARYLFSLPSYCNSFKVKPVDQKLQAARDFVRLQQAKALSIVYYFFFLKIRSKLFLA